MSASSIEDGLNAVIALISGLKDIVPNDDSETHADINLREEEELQSELLALLETVARCENIHQQFDDAMRDYEEPVLIEKQRPLRASSDPEQRRSKSVSQCFDFVIACDDPLRGMLIFLHRRIERIRDHLAIVGEHKDTAADTETAHPRPNDQKGEAA